MADQIALLHPGEMGVTVGACALAAGSNVAWAAYGRSEATRARATKAKFIAYGTVGELLSDSTVVLSLCPPGSAASTATQVAATGFNGVYVDANAVSPTTAAAIASIVEGAGATYVDGGIVGPPALEAGTTRLYLSGAKAACAVDLFTPSALEAINIGDSNTAASALKMCYAAWTKGSAALLLAVAALAQAENVAEPLRTEWTRSIPDLNRRLETTAKRNAGKAWRFEGEMHEIAETFTVNGLPSGFHRAAAETYALLSRYKDAEDPPALDDVLKTMLKIEAD
jgi:3-hydroxyisobutyrate dehydrogenase-like beta-hydroxyacid dehydrogenase